MDIVLATNTENPSFALRDVAVFADGGGIRCILDVQSGWVFAPYRFFVEALPCRTFLVALRELKENPHSDAVLKPEHEDQYVRFIGNGRGGITVVGELIEHGPHNQRLQFEFETDQTCLPSLIKGFEALRL